MSESSTIVLYAAYTFDKMLSTSNQLLVANKISSLDPLNEFMPDVLKHLLVQTLSQNDQSSFNVSNSEILLNAVIHIFVIFQEKAVQMIAQDFDNVIKLLITKIDFLSLNPENPRFLHSAYNLLALLIKISFKISPQSIIIFEDLLFKIFENFFSKQIESIYFLLFFICF